MTRFVRLALCSFENDLANPKSASFRLPSLSMRRFEPAEKQNKSHASTDLVRPKIKIKILDM